MNKHNLLGFVAVLLMAAIFPGSAQSETVAQQSFKTIESHVQQKCGGGKLHAALCACEMDKLKGPQFSVFAKSLKQNEDHFAKLQEYYTQNIVVPCLLDRRITQKLCMQNMKEQTKDKYSDKVIEGHCACMSEEIDEKFNKSSFTGLDNAQIMAKFSAEHDRAFKACDRIRD